MRKITLITISLLLLTASALAADNTVHGGAIARSPALVVAVNSPDIAQKSLVLANSAADALKKRGYKLYDNKVIIFKGANAEKIHNGLEQSCIFSFDGHGNSSEISNVLPNGEAIDELAISNEWFTSNPASHQEFNLEDPTNTVLINDDQYRVVFLNGCQTARYSHFANAFRISVNNALLGWKRDIALPKWGGGSGETDYSFFALDHLIWTKRFWKFMGQNNTVIVSRRAASADSRCWLVPFFFGSTIQGDGGTKLGR